MMRWSVEQAQSWYEQQPWLVGCNYIPSTASNQIEMWQAESFDPDTIHRELGWAADLGLNTVRVYLHDLVWQADSDGFKERINLFLRIASDRGISTLFVIFDDCWFPDPQLGPQPEPVPGQHNSRWVQSPGRRIVKEPAQWGYLQAYVQDLITTFGSDPRVVMWDIYNEVGNNYLPSLSAKGWTKWIRLASLWLQRRVLTNHSLQLLKQTFEWAWEVRPSQPLTSSIWKADEAALNAYLLETCDVISFHNYFDAHHLRDQIADLKQHQRPVICTEYLARTRNSRFETHLPIFKEQKVGCYNWGLVSGRTQTILSWQASGNSIESAIWFHDIFRKDGTPYKTEETEFIRKMTAMAEGDS